MNAEQIHDALTLLPDALLEQTNTLRCKKRTPWKAITALAACVCLAVGIWFIAPRGVSMDNSAEMEPEDAFYSKSQSQTNPCCVMQVTQVDTDCIWVLPVNSQTADTVAGNKPSSPIRLTFENLEQPPILLPGQRIRIFYDPADYDAATHTLRPRQIEIAED